MVGNNQSTIPMQVQNEMIVLVYLKGTYTIVAVAKPITIVSTSLLNVSL